MTATTSVECDRERQPEQRRRERPQRAGQAVQLAGQGAGAGDHRPEDERAAEHERRGQPGAAQEAAGLGLGVGQGQRVDEVGGGGRRRDQRGDQAAEAAPGEHLRRRRRDRGQLLGDQRFELRGQHLRHRRELVERLVGGVDGAVHRQRRHQQRGDGQDREERHRGGQRHEPVVQHVAAGPAEHLEPAPRRDAVRGVRVVPVPAAVRVAVPLLWDLRPDRARQRARHGAESAPGTARARG